MVIMNPNDVAWFVDGSDAFCKGYIGGLVEWIVGVCPWVFGCYVLPEEVVKEGPEC
jgi:hypothetical protein